MTTQDGPKPVSTEDRAGAPAAEALDGIQGYLAAAACVGLALLLRLALDPLWGDRLAYVTFFLAVFIMAQFAATKPVLVAMLAGFLLADWFFVPPRHSLLIAEAVNQVNAVLYFVICSVVLILSRRARLALGHERAARLGLQQHIKEREKLVGELKAALAEVKTLTGLLPICSHCKKIRDDRGYWSQIELYLREHSNANFTHSICPECARKFYPEVFNEGEAEGQRSEVRDQRSEVGES
jgi:K+-sensing histidine kinase KdpD